ncbi:MULTISPECIES: carbon storage regulator [Cysteiniphilum]|uniref:carbon storage regulator n=1 Tax=Cysteiniphilum TaxID=2056696 RepID=UPI001784BA40|nr:MULTISPECIES: carbon storage regulator [Cysteiniphilum]
MLLLTRKANQCIIINDDIVIKICDISRGQVKIGIKAPQDVKIMRQELHPLYNRSAFYQQFDFGAYQYD